jgi:thymidylate synthase
VSDFIWTGGDCHDTATTEQVALQLNRTPFAYPRTAHQALPRCRFDATNTDFEVKVADATQRSKRQSSETMTATLRTRVAVASCEGIA